MNVYLFFFAELILLFLLSQTLSKSVSRVIYALTRSMKVTVYGIAFLFFPGTLVHELAHYFLAALLQVPVGEMKFIPEMQEDGVKLGSVQIAKTDPFRRAIIGVAPFLTGMGILLGLFYSSLGMIHTIPWWGVIIGIYVVFEIANTMFSSRKDLEGTTELVLTLIVISIVLFFLGFRLPHTFFAYFLKPSIIVAVRQLVLYLLIPLFIDIGTIFLVKIILYLLKPRQSFSR